ncbi:MAG TPA: hypothetical protein VKD67_11165 [Acidimicrobiales bacterium]|nr:hypothetical protein [Acidimicrobiales bacterium]
MRHPRTVLTGIALLVASAATACGGGQSHRIASAAGVGQATSTTIDGDQAFLSYARCMRDHGVSDFPDPVQRPGHNGLSLMYEGDTSSAAFQTADGACRHFTQSIIDAKQRNAHDQLTPERLQGLINYARCMRDHQIPMLDPDPTDGHLSLGNVPGIANTVGRQDPEFQSADAACRSQLPAGVADDGSGPP